MKILKKIAWLLTTILIFFITMLTIYTTNWNSNQKGTNALNLNLKNILNNKVDGKYVLGAVVKIESQDGTFSWSSGAGNLNNDTLYAAASTTKMYTAAVILKLKSEGKLNLDDKISQYLPRDVISGLHVYKKIDYSNELTIRQLLFQTSGLPDIFEEKIENKPSFQDEFIKKDFSYNFTDILINTKKLKPHFKPNEKGNAYYADINFDILGKIIEKITNKTLEDVFSEVIYIPLNLNNTYLYNSATTKKLPQILFKNQNLNRPLFMSSTSASGGIISNTNEQMIFLKAFFNGKIFPKEYIKDLYSWNNLTNLNKKGLEYGGGIMRIKMLPIIELFYPNSELIGHSGATGSFIFYCPKKDLYITGTLNQMSNPRLPFLFMIQILHCFDNINLLPLIITISISSIWTIFFSYKIIKIFRNKIINTKY